jgi:hypothetical protein
MNGQIVEVTLKIFLCNVNTGNDVVNFKICLLTKLRLFAETAVSFAKISS